MTEKEPLLPLVQKFFEHDTAAAAHSLERMTEDEAVEVLLALPVPLSVRAIRHLQVSYAAALLKDAEPELFREIASALEPQYAATIFMHLPGDTREHLLEHIPGKLKTQIRELLTYPENSVGRIMTTDFLSFHKDVTAHEAIEKIRSLAQKRFPASYAYVIDDEEHLIGVMNMRDLMLAAPQQPLEAIMRTSVFSIHAFVDKEEAANELSRRRYFAAPIVDGNGRDGISRFPGFRRHFPVPSRQGVSSCGPNRTRLTMAFE